VKLPKCAEKQHHDDRKDPALPVVSENVNPGQWNSRKGQDDQHDLSWLFDDAPNGFPELVISHRWEPKPIPTRALKESHPCMKART